jgi:uroporphyrinogen decarboxylase
MDLTSRQRVLKAVNHEEPDRVPIDIGGTLLTGIHKNAHKNLVEYLGYPYVEEDLDIIQQLVKPDQRILDRFGNDCYRVLPGLPRSWSLEISGDEQGKYFTDEWGIVFKMPHRGFYFDVHKSPLSKATIGELKSFSWPNGKDPGRRIGLRERASKIYTDTEYALIMGDGTWGLMLHTAILLGFERYYDCFASDLRFLRAVLEKILEFEFDYMDSILPEVRNYIQIVQISDDLGTQLGPMINPKTYRELVKPLHRSLIENIRKHCDAKIFFHSCGAVSDFIPDFIEIGVDILNPVQVSAAGMDSKKLKAEFGNDIAFWGGGCDTQRVLPRGTPNDVKMEVSRRIHDFAPGGGFVFCPVHNVQSDVPPENLVAMYETALDCGGYPLNS